MFGVRGIAGFGAAAEALGANGQPPIEITSAGWYPEAVKLNATGLSVNTRGLDVCFTDGAPPKPLDGAIRARYPIVITDEPYGGQVSSLLSDITLDCDKLEFTGAGDGNQNSIKAYNSADPGRFVLFTPGGVTVPVNDVDELALFGSDIGGEISGAATVSDRQIELSLDVDGHLDNAYFGVRHDGKAKLKLILPRNASAGTTLPVTLTCDGQTLSYDADVTGSVSLRDEFSIYSEEDGE
jgi:hypothetical protein